MRLTDVAVRYRARARERDAGVHALADVSFEVGPGEKLGIIGSNGAGKSTLLRVMAGVLSPDSGTCDAEGMATALLSLSAGFDMELSGIRNIVTHGMLTGLTRQEAAARIPAIVETSGLGDAIHRRVSTYSNGMRARLCFWTAINLAPDLMLVDEVLAVGDEEFRRKSQQAMERLLTGHTAVVLVSHNADIMRRFCDRVIWLDDGVIRADGPCEEVVRTYRAAVASGNKPDPLSGRQIAFICGGPRSDATRVAQLLNCQPDAVLGIGRHRDALLGKVPAEPGPLFSRDGFLGAERASPEGTAGKSLPPRASEKFEQARIVGDTVPRLYRRLPALAEAFPNSRVVFAFASPAGLADGISTDDPDEFERQYLAVLSEWNRSLALAAQGERDGSRMLFVSTERLFGTRANEVFPSLLRQLGLQPRLTGRAEAYLGRVAQRSREERVQGTAEEPGRRLLGHADLRSYMRLLAKSI